MKTIGENTRLLLAGALALSALAIPALPVFGGLGASAVPLASCAAGELIDPTGGGCVAVTAVTPSSPDPINPEGAALQPGSITSANPVNHGQLPKIHGIPCTGANTGQCIGLSEVDSLQAHSSLSGLTHPATSGHGDGAVSSLN